MKIAGTTALVTGANRGFGRALAAELIARGATVYAGARNPSSVDLPGAIPVQLGRAWVSTRPLSCVSREI